MAGTRGKDPYPYFEWFDPRESAFPPPETGIFDAPNRQICINTQWVKWIAGVVSRLEYHDVYEGDAETIERAIQEILKFQFALGGGDNPCADERPPNVVYRYRPVPLPDCVELLDMDGDGIFETFNIREDCEDSCMVTINVYEGCGCGDSVAGSGGASGGMGGALGTGTDGALPSGQGVPASERVTVCDFVTNTVPFIAQKLEEIAGDFRQAAEAGEELTDNVAENLRDSIESALGAIPFIGDQVGGGAGVVGSQISSLWDSFTDVASNQPENFEELMNDSDFILRLQQEAYGVLSNADFSGQLTRPQLQSIMQRMPQAWGNPTQDTSVLVLRDVLRGFARFISLEKINLNASFSAGEGNAALCEYLAAQNGQTYTPPVAPDSVSPPLPDGQFNFTAASGLDYTVELFELNLSMPTQSAPATLPDINAAGKIFSGVGAQLSNVGSVDINYRSIRIGANGSAIMRNIGAPSASGEFAGDVYDNAVFTPQDIADIQTLVRNGGVMEIGETLNVASRDLSSANPAVDNYPITYRNYRSSATDPQPVVDFIWLVWRDGS